MFRQIWSGLGLVLRPARGDDLQRLKEFFGSLSDQSMYQRFSSARREVPDQRLQQFLSVDCSRDMLILAEIKGKEEVVGLGQYSLNPETHLAEVALVVLHMTAGLVAMVVALSLLLRIPLLSALRV